MSLNHYKKKNETRPPGCLWKAGWWAGGHPVPGTCIWYPVLGTWYLVPGTLYPVPGASTWSPSTWPHPRGCRTIAVAYLSVSIAAQQGWVQQIKGEELSQGLGSWVFSLRKSLKKENPKEGSILGSATNEISGLIISVLPPFSMTKILFYIMPIGYFDV